MYKQTCPCYSKIRKMKVLLFIVTLLVNTSIFNTNNILDDIGKLIIDRDAVELCKLVSDNIDLAIVDVEKTYSKSQAEEVLKSFFKSHKVKDFKVLHSGSNNKALEFAIARLVTENTSFRAYILVDKTGSSDHLIELRFEEE